MDCETGIGAGVLRRIIPFGELDYETIPTVLEKQPDTDSNLMIAAPNWAEVRYIVERKVGLRNGFSYERGFPVALDIVPADQQFSDWLVN